MKLQVDNPRAIPRVYQSTCAPRLSAYFDAIQALLLDAEVEAIKANDERRLGIIRAMLNAQEES